MDLDPVYVAINNSGLGENTLSRLCVAYWCFYHLGMAAHLAEIKNPAEFWQAMHKAAVNESKPDGTKPFPRGAERRHFRGAQAVNAVAELIKLYPSGAVAAVEGFVRKNAEGRRTYKSVSDGVQQHRGFGPWIAFKVADMSERVLGYDVDFDDCHLGIYKDPRQGAAVAYLEMIGQTVDRPWLYPITDDELKLTVEKYVTRFQRAGFTSPPANDRPVNVQEIETVFCKYKSHLKGHYPTNKDTNELRHSMQGWGDLAETLRSNLPKETA
jgi:hypothetical protein